MKTSLFTKQYFPAMLLVLAAVPYFVGLGASSLWDSNEAFYAETPRQMIESGDYINPSFNGRPRFNKPPLSYWAVASFYKLFGVSEASERLPIALGAMVMIGIAFALARLIFSLEAAWFAAMALALSPRFLIFSRRIIIDVYIAMFCGLALLFFALAESRPSRRRLYLALMYASIGLGVMTKGPIAAVLPGATFLIYFAVTRRPGRIREMMPLAGFAIIAAIVLPWYAAIYLEHGWLHIKTFLLDDNISRYTQPVWGPRRGLLFYLPVIMGDLFPWSLFLLPAAWFAARRMEFKQSINRVRSYFQKRDAAREEKDNPDEGASLKALLFIWVIVIVAFFSLSRNKEDLYILPAYPAAAAIIGGWLARAFSVARQPNQSSVAGSTAAIIGILMAAGGALALYLFNRTYDLAGATAIGCIALAGGVLSIGAASMKKHFAAVMLTAITTIAINWVFAVRALPDFERYKPALAFSEIISARAGPDALVGYYRFASPSMAFYLRRPVFEFYEREELEAALASGKEVYCLLTAEDYEAIKSSLPRRTNILASRPVFRLKLRGILDRIEIPQAVLIHSGSRATDSE